MMNKLCANTQFHATRRNFLQRTSAGFGWLAFSALAAEKEKKVFTNPLAPRAPHFPARAKRVIFLFMNGGPSHLESFDYKPELAKAGGRYLAPQFEFRQHGKSGLWISDAFPNLAKHADDLCLINSAQTKNPGHQQAIVALHTGNETFVRPSVGAWVTYGLGTENQNLPGFVVMLDPTGGPISGKANIIGTYEVFFGDYQKLFTAADDYAKVSKADVQRVAKQYFHEKNRTVVTLVPEKETK